VVDQELADALGDEFADTVNAVSAKLTEDAIIAMNSAVAIDQRDAAEVAREFLEANELL
jgi:osmoprotectant transport system substrate-binding protein